MYFSYCMQYLQQGKRNSFHNSPRKIGPGMVQFYTREDTGGLLIPYGCPFTEQVWQK